MLCGRITFTPVAGGYKFSAPTRFDKLFAGVCVDVPPYIKAGDARGTEHIRPEDTMDVDYGRLLERACGKGLVALPGIEPGSDG